jgi:glutamine synthetase
VTERFPELEALRTSCPGVRYLDAALFDLCGYPRGKRYPIDQAHNIFSNGVLVPGPVYLLDATGVSHNPCGYGFHDGDPDFPLRPIAGTLAPTRWSDGRGAQVLMRLEETDDGASMLFDPRNVLARALRPLAELGLQPVVAFELEFYLIAKQRDAEGRPVPAPLSGTDRADDGQVFCFERLDGHEALLGEIEAANREMGVPASVTISEYAPGQYEITLTHVADALRAADHCSLFRQIVRRMAQKHGLQATFLGRPFPDQTGSGMHIHLSLLDRDGTNIFADPAPEGSKQLQQAIAGLLALQFDAMAIYAPNVNSYRRYEPYASVPITRTWGANNRSAAVRIPAGGQENRRFEHRAACADANPYLVLASILAGVHHGISDQLDPGPPVTANACQERDPAFPREWREALDRMASSALLGRYLGDTYVAAYVEAKRLEREAYLQRIPKQEFDQYL